MAVKKELRILIVEDLVADAVLINHELRRGGLAFRSRRVDTREAFLHEIQQHQPDIILSDHGLPSFDGFAALALARKNCPDIPFIFVTGGRGEEVAVETLKSGATDYVLKSRLSRLLPAVQRALREAEERRKRKEAEHALRQNQECMRLLSEGVKDYAIFMLDAEGKVSTWNRGAERILGQPIQDVLGQPFIKFFPPEEIVRRKPEKILKVVEEQGRAQDEGCYVRRDGSLFWACLTLTSLRDVKGRLSGFSILAHDLTERKEAEEEITRLNEELAQQVQDRTSQLHEANQELEAFSYSMSHVLRQPLSHMERFLELYNQKPATLSEEQGRQLLQIVSESARQMGKLIDDLMAFSQMGRTEMYKSRFSLADLLKEVLDNLREDIQPRDLEWAIGHLPEVYADPSLLRLVLVNLISNALKYTRARAPARIEMNWIDADSEIVFFIRDNGVGFDMRNAGKLFGVFQRLHRAPEFEGTGIGLANVQRIIQRHGGRTWAEGEVDAGATFYFSLPLPARALRPTRMLEV